MLISTSRFVKYIAEDFGINFTYQHRRYYKDFPIKNGKPVIRRCGSYTIVDHNGIEYPYMINGVRNDQKLQNFHYLYIISEKTLDMVLKELNLTLKTQKIDICEGGGWTSKGTRYFYKEFICEN